MLFLVVVNRWDKISPAIPRWDGRKYTLCSSASSWENIPDCFTNLYVVSLSFVSSRFGNEKHSSHYGATPKAFGFSCWNSLLHFLVGNFHAPTGQQGCGERHHFKQKNVWKSTDLVHRGGWTHSLILITSFIGKLLNFLALSGQMLWSGDFSTASVSVLWCESFARVLKQKNCENLSVYSLKKRRCRWSDVGILIPLLPGEKNPSFPIFILLPV